MTRVLFDEKTTHVNRQQMRLNCWKVDGKEIKFVLDNVQSAIIYDPREMELLGYDEIEKNTLYLVVTLADKSTISWKNSFCSLREAR